MFLILYSDLAASLMTEGCVAGDEEEVWTETLSRDYSFVEWRNGSALKNAAPAEDLFFFSQNLSWEA